MNIIVTRYPHFCPIIPKIIFTISKIVLIISKIVYIISKIIFITNFVTHVRKFVTHITKFVIHVTKFVTNFFCAVSEKYQAGRKNQLGLSENFLPDSLERWGGECKTFVTGC